MNHPNVDTAFTGSVPQLYERYMVPLIFESYAVNMAARVAEYKPSCVLEIAAGTGVVTRQLVKTLPPEVSIIATDLNQAMLNHAAAMGTTRAVEWRQADAMQLPFPDASFDVVVCQFGAMFFPDKAQAFSEVKRVLRPGGAFIFNVWDRIEENEFADAVSQAVAAFFPDDPPRFMVRVPHGYFDQSVISQDLARGGFSQSPEIITSTKRSRAESAQIPALAFCQGTPFRSEIEARGPACLEEVTASATRLIEQRFGSDRVDAKIQAIIVTVER